MSKFGAFLPLVKNSMQHSAASHTLKQADINDASKYPKYVSDPFEKEKERLIAKIFPTDRVV
jgi:hypothetical protein